MARFASLEDEALARPWAWRSREATVRDALYRSLEEEHAALVRARGAWEPTEGERILALAQRAFGDLRGLLVGLLDPLLDRAPAEREWSLRQVLRHLLGAERRQATQVVYAAHRAEGEPMRMPDERLPKDDDAEVSGDAARILDRFAALRAQSDSLCGGLPQGALSRPTIWSGHEVDVRFRLHRFASHITEHTIQCEKTLELLGARQSEARRIVRRIWAARGELEAIDDEATLRALEAAHAERAASLP